MDPEVDFDLAKIGNINKIIDSQIKEFDRLRSIVKDLKFVPVDPVGTYTTVTYKSIDGGKMGIYFDPLKWDFVQIANSVGKVGMKFLVPKGESLQPSDFQFMDEFLEVKKFLNLLGIESIVESSHILTNPRTAMDLAEYACIFERLTRDEREPILVMMDGLLRTKSIKHEHIEKLIQILVEYKNQKLVGVAKSSKVLNLIVTALFIEKKIPLNQTGYIEIPLEIESLAYKWTGRGRKRASEEMPLAYAFGKLYVAKLSQKNTLLVTVEIPYDYKNKRNVYSEREINEIIGHLIKDSWVSYPIPGYPQTIMRAHEKAVMYGFTASIWKDKIIQRFLKAIGDKDLEKLIIDANFLREYVDKGILGGF